MSNQNDALGIVSVNGTLPLVSVIVGVYNKEKSISECLTSILGQTYSHLEIVLIDDGSTDGSSRQYSIIASRDHRVKVWRQPNVGHSETRNRGIELAVGDYLLFVDGDDSLARPEAIELMVNEALTNHCDVVWSDLLGVLDSSRKNPIRSGIEILRESIETRTYHPSMCGRLFARSAIGSKRFLNLVTDDEEWTPRVLMDVSRVGLVPEVLYRRNVSLESVTGRQTPDAFMRKGCDRIRAGSALLDLFARRCPTEPVLIRHASSVFLGALYDYGVELRGEKGRRDEILETLRRHSQSIVTMKLSPRVVHRAFAQLVDWFGPTVIFRLASVAIALRRELLSGWNKRRLGSGVESLGA